MHGIALTRGLAALILFASTASLFRGQYNGTDAPIAAGLEARGLADVTVPVDTVTIPGTDVRFTMALIPSGSFTIGSPDNEVGRDDDEGPQVTVELNEFWIGTHEVTSDEFAIYRFKDRDNDIAADTSFDVDAVTRPSPPYEDPAHGLGAVGHPATGMTQWAALQYARWLSAKTGDFYRLPTEAEWEYACRAGALGAYSNGDEPAALDDVAWFSGNSSETFHAVGQKAPNGWGLYDMHGNVSEWTLDQYEATYYQQIESDSRDPWSEPTKRHPRTVRGGAFDDVPEDLRCAARQRSSLTWKRRDPQIPKSSWWNTDSQFLGFRLVRVAKPLEGSALESFWDTVLR